MNKTALNMNQKVIDNDSFSIVKEYVKSMDEYDLLQINRTKMLMDRVVDDLNYIFEGLKEHLNCYPSPKQILDDVEEFNEIEIQNELDDLNDIEFARLNGYVDEDEFTDDYDEYYDDRDPYDGFMGWFNGASCDI